MTTHDPSCTGCEHDCPWRGNPIGAPFCSICDDHWENGPGKLAVRLFDYGNDDVADRYTAIFTTEDGEQWYLAMSEHPFHPQGFGQHGEGDVSGTMERNREIPIESAPPDVQRCIANEIAAYERGNA